MKIRKLEIFDLKYKLLKNHVEMQSKLMPLEVNPFEIKDFEKNPVELKPLEVKPVNVNSVDVKLVEGVPIEINSIIIEKKEKIIFPYGKLKLNFL